MSRYRLMPTPAQESALREHCAHARFVWNLAVEQQAWYGRAGRGTAPGWAAQCRQLTEARDANPWLAEGSVVVQQQALRDFRQAMANFFAGTHRKPRWRKAGRDEGFRIVAVVLNREILASGWALFARRLEDKAPGRVEKIPPAYTSQRCSACGRVDARSRKSQALFVCTACGYAGNADVNAARNIAAGHAVTARGGPALAGPVNREPQLALLAS